MPLRHLRIIVFPGMASLDIVVGSISEGTTWGLGKGGIFAPTSSPLQDCPHSLKLLSLLNVVGSSCPQIRL